MIAELEKEKAQATASLSVAQGTVILDHLCSAKAHIRCVSEPSIIRGGIFWAISAYKCSARKYYVHYRLLVILS